MGWYFTLAIISMTGFAVLVVLQRSFWYVIAIIVVVAETIRTQGQKERSYAGSELP